MSRESTEHIDVAYLADLARLKLSDDEISRFQGQLEQVVAYVSKLGELDLADIAPTAHAHPVQNIFRPDESRPGLDHEAVMQNAPAVLQGQFKVPQIVE